ncbi:MAG TPA: hypothetical protein VGP63_12595 [Planctomycetaceae bacterium]|nr:hypothetical protein [Planctomycetaceae bacterium]
MSYWDLFDFEDAWSWNRYGWKEEYNEPALWGCLLCVGFGVAFLVSACFALGEARYWAFGRTAQASVIRANPPDETDDAFVIRYGFTDAKTQNYREEVDAVPSHWGPPPDVLPVEYIPGRTGASRVSGNHNWTALGFFALTSLGLLGGLAYLYRDARRAFEPYHPHHHGHDSHDPHRHAYDPAGYSSQGHDSPGHEESERDSLHREVHRRVSGRAERPRPRGHWFPNS